MPKRIIIIGGGISGLTAAFWLKRNTPSEVILLEAGDRLGGVIRTLRYEDLSVEAAADTFEGNDPFFLDLCERLGLEPDLIPGRSSFSDLFIRKNKQTFPVPFSSDILKSPLLDLHAKARLALEAFIPPAGKDQDESLGGFIRRRFGMPFFREVADPLIRGVMMAAPDALSAGEYLPSWVKSERRWGGLSLSGSFRPKPEARTSFGIRGGMERVIEKLAGSLTGTDVRVGTSASAVECEEKWKVTLQSGEVLKADVVLLALPAPQAARLLAGYSAVLSGKLAGIRYDPAMVLNMVFHSRELPKDLPGSGFVALSSGTERPFASLKLVGTEPAGEWTKMKLFVSGVFQKKVFCLSPDEARVVLVRSVREEWGFAEPSWTSLEYYPEAIVPYAPGHARKVVELEAECARHPGLFLTGNGYRGFGITDCAREAVRKAREAACQLKLL